MYEYVPFRPIYQGVWETQRERDAYVKTRAARLDRVEIHVVIVPDVHLKLPHALFCRNIENVEEIWLQISEFVLFAFRFYNNGNK